MLHGLGSWSARDPNTGIDRRSTKFRSLPSFSPKLSEGSLDPPPMIHPVTQTTKRPPKPGASTLLFQFVMDHPIGRRGLEWTSPYGWPAGPPLWSAASRDSFLTPWTSSHFQEKLQRLLMRAVLSDNRPVRATVNFIQVGFSSFRRTAWNASGARHNAINLT